MTSPVPGFALIPEWEECIRLAAELSRMQETPATSPPVPQPPARKVAVPPPTRPRITLTPATGNYPCSDNPDLWFSRDRDAIAQAKKGCRRCPILVQCRDDAIRREDHWGVWGGLTSRDRLKLRRQAA